jgi:hypothetical protein
MIGMRFGRLTVERQVPSIKGLATWLCFCDCGDTIIAKGALLRAGNVKSCGCLRREMGVARGHASARHGEGMNGKETPEYRAWTNMLSRCNNPNHAMYSNYGGRGIRVCIRWHIYENFLEDMGRKPSPKHSIDRIDNREGYRPGNCRWATCKEQNRNNRGNRWIEIEGRNKTLAEWLEITGIPKNTFYNRLKTGATPEAALFPNGYQP